MRAGMRRAVATWCAFVLLAGVVAALVERDSAVVDVASAAGPTTTAAPTSTTAPASTTAPPATTVPSSPATTAADATATTAVTPPPGRSASTTTTTAPAVRGTLGNPGLYVLDVATGAVRLLAEPGPWTLVGGDVLVGRGRDVYRIALDGSGATLVTLPPSPVLAANAAHFGLDLTREAITGVEAAPDGTLVVTVFAPSTTSSGSLGATRVFSPAGVVLDEDFGGTRFAVSRLGVIAESLSTDVDLYGTDAVLRATVATDPLYDLRWGPDNRLLLGRSSSGGGSFVVDTVSGTVTALGDLFADDLGPGGTVIGRRYVQEGTGPRSWVELRPIGAGAGTVVTDLPLSAIDLTDDGTMLAGARSPYAPDHILNGEGQNLGLEVLDVAGHSLQRLSAAEGLSVDGGGFGPIAGAPAWTDDGRSVVFAVVADPTRVV